MFTVTGEVRDKEGRVNYHVVGAWDSGLELHSVDGKVTSLYIIFFCQLKYYGQANVSPQTNLYWGHPRARSQGSFLRFCNVSSWKCMRNGAQCLDFSGRAWKEKTKEITQELRK